MIVVTILMLILLLNVGVLWEIRRNKMTKTGKVLSAILVLAFPIVGVTIYYLIEFLSYRVKVSNN